MFKDIICELGDIINNVWREVFEGRVRDFVITGGLVLFEFFDNVMDRNGLNIGGGGGGEYVQEVFNCVVNVIEMFVTRIVRIRGKLKCISASKTVSFLLVCVCRVSMCIQGRDGSVTFIQFAFDSPKRVVFSGKIAKERTPVFLFFFVERIFDIVIESFYKIFECRVPGTLKLTPDTVPFFTKTVNIGGGGERRVIFEVSVGCVFLRFFNVVIEKSDGVVNVGVISYVWVINIIISEKLIVFIPINGRGRGGGDRVNNIDFEANRKVIRTEVINGSDSDGIRQVF